uniref:Ig-like domain-containing protein n=1 Tax=Sus scrofa TaxID=9823 RepID=F1S6S1_PIG
MLCSFKKPNLILSGPTKHKSFSVHSHNTLKFNRKRAEKRRQILTKIANLFSALNFGPWRALLVDVSGGTGAQSVTQPDSLITVPEGDAVELRCKYSSSVPPYLFWYVQYPNQGLQLLLKYTSGNSFVSGIRGFGAEFRKNETSFHLRKTSVHLSDSAKYFCALIPLGILGLVVLSVPPFLYQTQPGSSVPLSSLLIQFL